LVKKGASETPILLAANRIVAINPLPLLKILFPDDTRSGNSPEKPSRNYSNNRKSQHNIIGVDSAC